MASDPAVGTLISELRVGADIDAIAEATSWLSTLAEEGGWPDAMRFGLELSLEEALTNVVMHGFKGLSHAPDIRIECYRMPNDRVAVRILDNGVAFDPTHLAEPDVPDSLEEAKIGGHGVQLMRNFLESLAYVRAGDQNQLTLVAAPKAD